MADRQHRVISLDQLSEIGLSEGAVRWRISVGRLHRIYKGVYAVGHQEVSREGRLLAAVLSVGDDAAVSHQSAGGLWSVRRWSGRIHVTCPRRLKDRDGLKFHERPLPADEVCEIHGIPVTSPHRTLLDLAGVLAPEALEKAYEQSLILELTDELPLVALFERYPQAKGINRLRGLTVEPGITREELERRFRRLIRGLPRPQTNIVIEGFEVDAVWRDQRLIAELDGRATHLNPIAFERDRERDRILAAAGWRVIRITWRQLTNEPDRVTADLRAILGRSR